ncbi:MAG: riboflavin synthase [Salinivenus sp.]
MFTGIIEELGRIVDVDDLGGGRRLTIEAAFASDLRVDQSVSINGACQTVVAVDADASTFAVDTIEETLRKTTFDALAPGTPVNLERALQAGDRLDGHFVQGHVDATGTITEVEQEETDWLYTIQFDPQYAAYLIPVGSIAIDGISLTVARLDSDTLTVAIIPHTYENTNVKEGWTEGAAVNLEFDLIGKYVARSLSAQGETPDPDALAESWLRE